jgi:P-type E1-E2 ATPase
MIELNIPGRGIFQIEYLVCDVNGTLALDGKLIPGVKSLIRKIQDRLKVYLITADTHTNQNFIDSELGLQAKIIQKGQEAFQKSEFINQLGADKVIAIGQGANDSEMLKTAAIGICVLSEEGTALESILSADIIVKNEISALRLVLNPLRIVATLRR